MSGRSQFLIALGAIVLSFWVLLSSPPPQDESVSSFGTIPEGHAALFEFLSRLGKTPGRSLRGTSSLPRDAVVWWLEPAGVCNSRIALSGSVDVLDADAVRWPALAWIEAGGVAVVWLEPEGTEQASCDAIAQWPVPGRIEATNRRVEGRVAPVARELEVDSLLVFGERGEFDVAASVGGHPVVLERSVGDGVLVLVSDTAFVRNSGLGSGDAAPLVVDLVRAYGEPYFDEREHGFLPETSAFRYVARSAAWPVFAGVALLGVLFAWRGHALPAREVAEHEPATPTLETFVTSLSGLYAHAKDYEEIFERYRALQRARVRRYFGLPSDLSGQALAARLAREAGRLSRGSDRLAVLLGAERVAIQNAQELRRRAAELDQDVEELIS